jgi:hypothetical protein
MARLPAVFSAPHRPGPPETPTSPTSPPRPARPPHHPGLARDWSSRQSLSARKLGTMPERPLRGRPRDGRDLVPSPPARTSRRALGRTRRCGEKTRPERPNSPRARIAFRAAAHRPCHVARSGSSRSAARRADAGPLPQIRARRRSQGAPRRLRSRTAPLVSPSVSRPRQFRPARRPTGRAERPRKSGQAGRSTRSSGPWVD